MTLKRSLGQKYTRYTSSSAGSAASKFGQLIGSAFEAAVVERIREYLARSHPDYVVVQPAHGADKLLNMFGGKKKRIDNVISPVDSDDPVALIETKWLKDARHHNDKGAWILQLREIRKQYPSIRGTTAVLIGFWTRDVVVFLMNEGQVEAVRVATDEQVYASLQPCLDKYLEENGLEPLRLDPQAMRKKYKRAWDLANFIQYLDEQKRLLPLAAQWLEFVHPDEPGKTGIQKIHHVLDKLLRPLEKPRPTHWEVTIHIDSGNLIHGVFEDLEELQAFLLQYTDPQNILKYISPRKRRL